MAGIPPVQLESLLLDRRLAVELVGLDGVKDSPDSALSTLNLRSENVFRPGSAIASSLGSI